MLKSKRKSQNQSDENHTEADGTSVKELFSTKKYPSTDFIDRLLRLGVGIISTGFTSGLISGMIEGVTEIELSFGSPVSIGLFTVFFISFWLLFSNVGRFKNK